MQVWPELLSGIVGVLIGVVATIFSSQRALFAANVIAERTKWRDKVRDLAAAVIDAASPNAGRNWAALALVTNPRELDDVKIVMLAKLIEASGVTDKAQVEEFVERVALMLKHDWDRSKIEASWRPGAVPRATTSARHGRCTAPDVGRGARLARHIHRRPGLEPESSLLPRRYQKAGFRIRSGMTVKARQFESTNG